MAQTKFKREIKGDKPVIALCYDFDKTLIPNNMQEQGFIQDVGYSNVKDFWDKSNGIAEEEDMDYNLAYMYTMIEEARNHKVSLQANDLAEYGSKITFFKGVEDWFERIRKYGEDNNVIVEHYIISSGLKEMIEGTSVAKKGAFKKIYATSFVLDNNKAPVWPAQVVNYTNKTQFLFRISKGVLDVNDPYVNKFYPPEKIRVPFRNMIYIGDSDTDVPCMKLVNASGGYSIGVFNPSTEDKEKVHDMITENRISYFAPADYSEGKDLDRLVKLIIDKTAFNEQLIKKHYSDKNEADQKDETKFKLLIDLENSETLESSEKIFKELIKYDNWQDRDLEKLFSIINNNKYAEEAIENKEFNEFVENLLNQSDFESENRVSIQRKIIKT